MLPHCVHEFMKQNCPGGQAQSAWQVSQFSLSAAVHTPSPQPSQGGRHARPIGQAQSAGQLEQSSRPVQEPSPQPTQLPAWQKSGVVHPQSAAQLSQFSPATVLQPMSPQPLQASVCRLQV
jgi:hypothetical protein